MCRCGSPVNVNAWTSSEQHNRYLSLQTQWNPYLCSYSHYRCRVYSRNHGSRYFGRSAYHYNRTAGCFSSYMQPSRLGHRNSRHIHRRRYRRGSGRGSLLR